MLIQSIMMELMYHYVQRYHWRLRQEDWRWAKIFGLQRFQMQLFLHYTLMIVVMKVLKDMIKNILL